MAAARRVTGASAGGRWGAGVVALPAYGVGTALYLSTLLLCARRVTADGYDGVGFVLALTDLDLARWQPQPPGYPLLILLGRMAAALGLSPAVAVAAVNALLLGAGLGALAWGLRRLVGPATGLLAALLLPVGPLALALALSTLSDAAGLGALLLAVAPLLRADAPTRGRLLACGIGAGLALGVRPAYAPLLGALLLLFMWHVGWRPALQAAGAAALTCLGWLVPLAAVVGPRALWTLSLAHAQGHFTDGNTVGTLGLGHRLGALLSTTTLGAVGPLVLVWLGLVAAALFLRPPRLWSTSLQRLVASLLVLLVGYGLFVLLALPVHGHGRHVLPLTVVVLALVAIILGSALAVPTPRLRPALTLCTALALIALWSYSLRTAWAFRRTAAPAAALATYVTTHFLPGTPLYGARAARQLDALQGSGSARPAHYLGEVLADATRPGPTPSTVLLTSEVLVPPAAAARLHPLGRFCYAATIPPWLRADRFDTDCVTLFAYRVRP